MANSIVHNHVPVQDLTLFKVLQPYEQMLREREKRLNCFFERHAIFSNLFIIYIYTSRIHCLSIFLEQVHKKFPLNSVH